MVQQKELLTDASQHFAASLISSTSPFSFLSFSKKETCFLEASQAGRFIVCYITPFLCLQFSKLFNKSLFKGKYLLFFTRKPKCLSDIQLRERHCLWICLFKGHFWWILYFLLFLLWFCTEAPTHHLFTSWPLIGINMQIYLKNPRYNMRS